MRTKLIMMGLLLAGTSSLLHAQMDLKPEALQRKIQACIAKSYAASVFIADYDTVAKRNNGQLFSGVVVSKDGIVLTAAHVGKTGKIYKILFPDGKETIAIGMGRIQRFDAAVLKITKPGSWPYAEMGWSSSLKVNEPCLSIAFPGSFSPPRPVIRFGYVANPLDARRRTIRTTCLMEPGDSGGPVFDLYGRVIGLHSNITVELENNYEVPIDVFRKYWSAFMKQQDYTELPQEEVIPVDPLAHRRVSFSDISGVEKNLADTELKLKKLTVQLAAVPDTSRAVGTIVKFKDLKNNLNSTYIVSKNSLLPGSVIAMIVDGKTQPLKVIYRDQEKDLLLLEMDKVTKVGIDLSTRSKDTLAFGDLGKVLISPHPRNEGKISVLGTLRFNLPGLYSTGYLGSRIEMENGRNVVKLVQEKSPASNFGLKIGDEVLSINGIAVSSPEQFIKEIQKTKPNDVINLITKRDGTENKIAIKLTRRPNSTSTHAAERFTDGKSDRRDGFKHAFVHDGKLKPAECGGPLFDLQGNFVGINMARYSRTSSIAITAAEVRSFVLEALDASQKISTSK
ncbi:trypsin-like peptidase domain-containing protein [Pedobacter zeae]|uniref:Serine protease Do n=1 Tax=Pedobacter zeae TaxID=1737356 RepID=A0A7W6P5V3_9SPHI|nr:trypsin-like peptidase domain-containing protein [Pedobacter zeae]MBB4107376.1 serine protease Do [Pedobacter zeae]GGH07552.1 hypothetical protein GCM10007422_24660 [Pedobacter zeae]